MGIGLFMFGMLLLAAQLCVVFTPWGDAKLAPKWFNDACWVTLVNAFTFMLAGVFFLVWS